MKMRNMFITVNTINKTITLKPKTTRNNIFVKQYLAKGYTIEVEDEN